MRGKSFLLIAVIPLLISACTQNETPTVPTISPVPSPPNPITTPATLDPTTTPDDVLIAPESDPPDIEATVAYAVRATVSAALTATATAKPTPTATATPIPEPTATATPTPVSTATATSIPEPTATAAPAPEPTATAVAAPEPTATTMPAPEPTATAVPAPPPQSEAQYQVSIQNVDLAGEVVVIVNTGVSPQVMTGWELLSQEGGQRFVFPRFTLNSGAAVRVTSGPNGRQDPPGVLQWLKSDGSPYRGHVWNNDGDVAILFDSLGNEVSRFAQT